MFGKLVSATIIVDTQLRWICCKKPLYKTLPEAPNYNRFAIVTLFAIVLLNRWTYNNVTNLINNKLNVTGSLVVSVLT